MMGGGSSLTPMANTAKARVLGAELRELRGETGLSVRGMEQQLAMSRSTISRIERGEKVPSAEDLGALLALYKVTGKRRKKLIEMAKDADQPNWTEVGHPGIPQQLSALIEFEREATRISVVAPSRIPGILQTRCYARAVMRSCGVPDNEVETLVSIRMGRQEALSRPDPAKLDVLLDESVLRRPVGGAAAMAEQLRQVAKVAAMTQVTVQVIPFSRGEHIGQGGHHVVYEFNKADPIVHLEHHRAGSFLDQPEDTSEFQQLTATLRELALDPDNSADLIADHISALEKQ